MQLKEWTSTKKGDALAPSSKRTGWRTGGEGQQEGPEEPEAEEAITGRTDACKGAPSTRVPQSSLKMFKTIEPDHVKAVNADDGWEEIEFALDSMLSSVEFKQGAASKRGVEYESRGTQSELGREEASGRHYFTMVSLHIKNTHAKKRRIAKHLLLAVRTVMHQQQVDLVAGDFNGAAWRRQSGSDSRSISSIEEAFVNTSLPLPPGPTPLWGPGGVPGEWSDVCGFLKPPGPKMSGKSVCMEPPLSLTACWISRKQIKVAIIHLLHVNARLVGRVSREDKHRRPISRKRKSPYDHSKERRQNH